jgi:glucose-1-phosphate cytidylyltransferase
VKVVIFCGGMGLRMREASEAVPKPMVPIGHRPILWHVMKYYASWGHKEFILCLGYKGDVIKDYFLNYSEALTNDFVLTDGGKRVELLASDIHDWEITFVNTGMHTNLGGRLKAVSRHLEGEEMFLANYGDVLTDAHLPSLIVDHQARDVTASFLAVRPNYTFHIVTMDEDRLVRGLQDVTRSDVWINGGYFVFRRDILDEIGDGEELVEEPFHRLAARDQLLAHRHEGFWAPMDTLKDKQRLEALLDAEVAPWRVWDRAGVDGAPVVG